jgi:putative membrane protein
MLKKTYLLIVLGTLLWSGIAPHDRLTWAMEIAPVVLILPVVLISWRHFPLTGFLCGLLTFHAVILIVGGKYTYAEMPLFNWIRDTFELTRNHYDRLGHFVQGFVPAILARELLLRTSPLKPGKWLFVIIVMGCLGFSAIYELIEWQAAVGLGSGADAFLATQGDVWDTQKDMALAGIGAMVSLLLLSRLHDRALEKDIQ